MKLKERYFNNIIFFGINHISLIFSDFRVTYKFLRAG